MRLTTYLFFNGQCEEAFKFYEKVLGGKITAMMPHKGSPAESHTPPEWHDKILHANLDVGESSLMASDAPPGHYTKPGGFSVSINLKSPADAERIFHALAEKGTVNMPIQKTFWSEKFGMLVDRYGIGWMVNCESEQK
jgi:PhnB protein